ncbi:HOOK2 protein, partial [Notiomystis cincta]|nr:HOOK2 protein [Notiomystis cincta]
LTGSGFRSSTKSPLQKPSVPPGDPPGTPPLAPVLQLLRNQLQEKDALIRHLEVRRGPEGGSWGSPAPAEPPKHPPQSDWERSRAQREREERLLVTAWYNMGLALQQQEEGMASRGLPSGAQSFLAQQRLATFARRSRTPHGRVPSS